jgi:YVTN family beta-propeller protein
MPCALAVNSSKDEMYVANYVDGTVTILEKEQPVATLKVAPYPQALVIDADKSRLYVASPQEDRVTIIDLISRRVLRSVSVNGGHPYAIIVQPVTHSVYTVNQSNEPFTKIDE